jgi:hypothetical protein
MTELLQTEETAPVSPSILLHIGKQLSVVDQTLVKYGALSLGDYFSKIGYRKSKPLQSLDDLLAVVFSYIAPVLGKQVAEALVSEIKNHPVILTANHHGVDYFAQSFQGNLLFFQYRWQSANSSRIVPIFSCGGVPLSNSSYPKGILAYDAIQPDTGELPFKLPVFPNDFGQKEVLATPRFTPKMVKSTLQQLLKHSTSGVLPKRVTETIRDILESEYLDPLVLSQPDYSRQAVVLNNRLGKRIFTSKNGPEFVNMEFETIASWLLKRDLMNSESLAFKVFFDDELRRTVMRSLNGKKGCWRLEKLEDLPKQTAGEKTAAHILAGYGTAFIWGLDILGRHFPYTIIDSAHEELKLVGIDSFGVRQQIPFTPNGISAALDAKLIYPNLFTMFMVVSFARAVECVGGYFQSEYLPAMQSGLVHSLLSFKRYEGYAESVASVTTNSYLSGMMFLLARSDAHHAVPAGPLEIIGKGGISQDFIKEAMSITVAMAHQIGIFNMYPDICPRLDRPAQWQRKLAMELCRGNSDLFLLN